MSDFLLRTAIAALASRPPEDVAARCVMHEIEFGKAHGTRTRYIRFDFSKTTADIMAGGRKVTP